MMESSLGRRKVYRRTCTAIIGGGEDKQWLGVEGAVEGVLYKQV